MPTVTTTKSQHAVTKVGAPAAVVPTTIPLNAKNSPGSPGITQDHVGSPIMYRIGINDIDDGPATGFPDGFVHFNQTNGKAWQAVGGVWSYWGPVGNLDAIDPTLIDRWYSTLPAYAQSAATVGGNAIQNQSGYRIGVSDRTLGETADAPEGFLVYNQTNSKTFKVQGGMWVDGGTFPTALFAAWLDSAVSYTKTNNVFTTGSARIA